MVTWHQGETLRCPDSQNRMSCPCPILPPEDTHECEFSKAALGWRLRWNTKLAKPAERDHPLPVLPVALALGLDQGFQPASATDWLHDLQQLLIVLSLSLSLLPSKGQVLVPESQWWGQKQSMCVKYLTPCIAHSRHLMHLLSYQLSSCDSVLVNNAMRTEIVVLQLTFASPYSDGGMGGA